MIFSEIQENISILEKRYPLIYLDHKSNCENILLELNNFDSKLITPILFITDEDTSQLDFDSMRYYLEIDIFKNHFEYFFIDRKEKNSSKNKTDSFSIDVVKDYLIHFIGDK